MLRALSKKHHVTILSFDPSTDEGDFAAEPFRVVCRPAPAWRAAGLFRNWLPFVREEVRKLLMQSAQPSILIATTSTLAAFDVCPEATARVALVQAYENFGLSCRWVPTHQRINLGKLAAVRRFQDTRLMRSADAVLTNSQFMRTAISDRFRIHPERIHVLKQDCAMEVLPSTPPPKTIGFVNRGAEKGLSFVLELATRSPELRYLIYGHDRGRPDVLPENVEWRGWASDRNAMFKSAKLWLVPSRWAEPFGRVSIEAQAANRAVLVAATGGLPETVTEDKFQIQGFDLEKWLTRIKDLLVLCPEDLQRNGTKIRATFSSEEHDKRIHEVTDRIMGNHREA